MFYFNNINYNPYGFGWAVYADPKYGKIIQQGGSQQRSSSFFSIYLAHKRH